MMQNIAFLSPVMLETIRQLDFDFSTYSCVLNVSVMCQLCVTIVFITMAVCRGIEPLSPA